MNTSAMFLGIDLGTSGTRIAVINSSGELVHTESMDYPTGLQIPEDWITCCEALLEKLPISIKKNLVSLSLDGTSGTLLASNCRGQPLGKALPYFISCPEQAQKLATLNKKGEPFLNTNSSLARALRLTNEFGPDLLLRHQADWVTGWLLDNWQWGEEGNNIRLGWNLITQAWPSTFKSEPWVKALPRVVPSGRILAKVSQERANKLGLPEETLLIAGTTDSNAAVLATELGPEDGITVLGSTIVLKRFVQHPINGEGITNHRLAGKWLCGGASNSGGAVLNQFFNNQELLELSRQINPHSESGLLLRPLLSEGERFPINDHNLQPILEPRPISDSLYLHALLEGLTRIEGEGWARLASLGAPSPKRIITIGGGAKNPQWRQLRQRMLKVQIQTCTNPPAQGVAKLAMRAVSPLYKSFQMN